MHGFSWGISLKFRTFTAAVLAASLSAMAGNSSAQVVSNLTFDIDGSEPDTVSVYFFDSSGNCSSTGDSAKPIDVKQIVVSATGLYTVTTSGPDGQYALYPSGQFDPANPAMNCDSSIDSTITVNLAAGNYTLIGGPQSGTAPGLYTVVFDGVGTVTEFVAPPAAVPTLSEWAMILFGTLLAGLGGLYIQRRRLAA